MKILTLVLALGLLVAPAFADGSEPMPLCHPTPGHPCSKAIETVAFTELHPNYALRDGGPLPMCPPRCMENPGAAGCPRYCSPGHLIPGQSDEVNLFGL